MEKLVGESEKNAQTVPEFERHNSLHGFSIQPISPISFGKKAEVVRQLERFVN